MKPATSVGVVGLGNISSRHRKNLRILHPDATVFLVSSSKRQLPPELLNENEYLLENVDALAEKKLDFAVVCSPATFHRQHAEFLLRSGIPTLIEKPLATSVADCDAIIEAYDRGQTTASVGYCLRFLPAFEVVRSLLHDTTLGEILTVNVHCGQYLPDWRPSSDYKSSVSATQALGGGVLLELSHELDYVQALLGDVSLQFAQLRISPLLELEVENTADLMLSADNINGIPVHVHLNFLERKASRFFEITGDRGRLRWDLIDNRVTLYSREGETVILSDPQWDKNQMYLNMLSAFYTGDFSRLTTLDSARRTVQLIENIKGFASSV